MERLQSQPRPDLTLVNQNQAPDMAIDGQYDAMAAQAVSEANEQQNQQAISLNPFLVQMFLRSHGNREMTKLFAGLLAADYVSKKVIQYAEYNPQVAEVAHMEAVTREQVAQSIDNTDHDENVAYAPFGQRKRKKGKALLAKAA